MIFNKTPSNSKTHPTPNTTPYELIGGEDNVRRLADKFYDIMESSPQTVALYEMHPLPLNAIRQKFFEFLSGWLGGPSLFEEKYGHPRLRMRHMPFTVTPTLRDQWMFCFNGAVDEVIKDKLLAGGIKEAIGQLASHMINQDDKGRPV